MYRRGVNIYSKVKFWEEFYPRDETIGSCFVSFFCKFYGKIYRFNFNTWISNRESINNRSRACSFDSLRKRDSRQVCSAFVFSEGRTNFLKCCTSNELWQARFFGWKARATDWQDEFSFYFPLLRSGEPSTFLASTTRAIPSGQKWNGELWRRIIHSRAFVSSKRFIRIDKEGNGYWIARTGIGHENYLILKGTL